MRVSGVSQGRLIGFMLLVTNLLVHRLFGWAAVDGVRGWVANLGSSSFRVERNVFIWPTPVRTDGRVGA